MKSAFLFVSLILAGAIWAAPDKTAPIPQNIEKLDPNFASQDPQKNIQWYDIRKFGLEGQGWPDTAHPFDRLPAKAEGVVRDPVWRLSQNSAGICARFVTDASQVSARWTLRFDNLAMDHMPATGVSGLDLYVKDGKVWRWVALGRPKQLPGNETLLVSDAPAGFHEYLLFLPLYNGVDTVEIGVAPEATVAKAAPRNEKQERPICIYGTSITQGGCAARPGMAYPAILSRRLDRPVLNLGFSGNGKMEPEMADLLAELDPAVYVLDCLPNMDAKLITERVVPFVQTLRDKRPETPILLVENIVYQNSWFRGEKKESYSSKNEALRATYKELQESGIGHLHYLPCEHLLGDDGEATVDGVHATDLGFFRMANAFEPVLRGILESN